MSAIELLEQAVNLLRAAPFSAVAAYLTGAVPFTLALLFFLNDMTRSPFASERIAVFSLALAALYIWKNTWQAVFARGLYQSLSPARTHLNVFRLILFQAALQPIGLVLMLPFPWIVAFFRNAALMAALNVPDPIRTARRQSVLWTKQNWGAIGLLSVAGLLLFANFFIAIALLPQFARSFLGIEGEFARLGTRIVNPATAAVAAALAWIVLDPLFDAVYALRCFYGESLATGEDLLAALRKAVAAAAILVCLLLATPYPVHAQVDPVRLDRSIDQVVHSREFTWRAPHAGGQDAEGRWVGWVRSAEDLWNHGWDWVKRAFRAIFERKSGTLADGKDAPVTRRMLESMIGLVIALIVAAVVAFFMRRRAPVVVAEAITVATPAVNLADDSVTADQMPESSWRKLADEWLAKGDCRLALRALYLAGLNYLSGRNLVSIRRWKSVLDYRRELERRSRANPEVAPVFTRSVAIFERGWYGPHLVDREMVESFASGLTEIKTYLERVP
jgi:hypothetical protein